MRGVLRPNEKRNVLRQNLAEPPRTQKAIATYIEFYNDHRIKISLDGLSIAEYRKVNVASD
ncbi:IS3 family transposase [Corynebacterium diphtheriae]|uniref:IS3 family transposase n=1 Tax=Corynebacterium diphtheriae TaxID=1717 RepID=UPI001FD09E24|nr:IS3 family transposase [Corynebacterium diphtheriae]